MHSNKLLVVAIFFCGVIAHINVYNVAHINSSVVMRFYS